MSRIMEQLTLESKEKYRSSDEVTKKWFKEYGRISSQNTFEENRGILQEAFNLVDIVADNKLFETIQASTAVDKKDSRLSRFDQRMIDDPYSAFYERNGRIYCVRKNQYNSMNFYSKIDALGFAGIISRQTRTDINSANFGVRMVRNGNSHINATIMEKTINLDTNTLRALISILGKALVEMGMISTGDINPSYEKLRIHSGSLVCKKGYKVVELIGEGGSGRVYLGIKLNTQAKVAIKELKPTWCTEQMFAKEREILVRLQHNMIPVIYEAFDENSTYYIIMQYIDGATLDRAFGNVTDFDTALKASIEICGLVQYLQTVGEGLIHGDIKPQNMLVDKAGSIHLVDFGTADSHNSSNNVSGSAEYTAPELIGSGKRTLSSDVYSIGMLMSQILFAKCSMSENCREMLSGIIMKATSSDPQLRYQSAGELKNALEQIRQQLEADRLQGLKQVIYQPVYVPQSTPQMARRIKKKKFSKKLKIIFASVTVAVMLITVGIIMLIRSSPNVYHNSNYSDAPDDKGLTHTVIWAEKDAGKINTRIVIKNDTGKEIKYRPIYTLTCFDSSGNLYFTKDCELVNEYVIPDGESHRLDCQFDIQNSKEIEKFNSVNISELHFTVSAKYTKEEEK